MGAALATAPMSTERGMGGRPPRTRVHRTRMFEYLSRRGAPVVPGTENKVPGTIHRVRTGGPPLPDKGGQPFPPPCLRERLVPQTSRRKSRVLDVLANDAARCPLCLWGICVSARVYKYVYIHTYVVGHVGNPLLIPLLCLLIPCVFAKPTTCASDVSFLRVDRVWDCWNL